jgi:hypothetical protein
MLTITLALSSLDVWWYCLGGVYEMSSSQIGMTTIDVALYVCLIIHSKEILLGQEETSSSHYQMYSKWCQGTHLKTIWLDILGHLTTKLLARTVSCNTTIIMQFHELTDDRQWDLIRSSLPRPAYTGRPRANDRMTLNGILHVLMSGCRWMDGYNATQVRLLQDCLGAS